MLELGENPDSQLHLRTLVAFAYSLALDRDCDDFSIWPLGPLPSTRPGCASVSGCKLNGIYQLQRTLT